MLKRQPIVPVLLLLMACIGIWPGAQPSHAAGARAIDAGFGHTCALTASDGVKCWGDNVSSQNGDGTVIGRTTPVDVAGLPEIAAVSAGFGHTCALTSAGGVTCWGKNIHGQLGDGQACGSEVCGTPVIVLGLANGALAVSAGANHSCALTEAGGVKCWGLNHFGQLGAETPGFCILPSFPCSTIPLDVSSLESGAKAVAAGTEHSCAITSSGGVKCWGKNYRGQLGDGTQTDSTAPVDVIGLESGVAAIAAGGFHTCALTTSGGVLCWGRNQEGELGLETSELCVTEPCSTTPLAVPGLSEGVQTIAAGGLHTCAVTDAGAGFCWGDNTRGQIGNGQAPDTTSPTLVLGVSQGLVLMAAGQFHTCAVDTAGAVLCWGQNADGQIGDGTTSDRGTPVAVFGFSGPPDSDLDGCTDEREAGTEAAQGGQRDPKNFWDFFDPNRDRSVTVSDFFALLQRFGAVGDPNIDPLSVPPLPPAYHTRFDRGGVTGANAWNLGPPNGAITTTDFFSLLVQFGHTCA